MIRKTDWKGKALIKIVMNQELEKRIGSKLHFFYFLIIFILKNNIGYQFFQMSRQKFQQKFFIYKGIPFDILQSCVDYFSSVFHEKTVHYPKNVFIIQIHQKQTSDEIQTLAITHFRKYYCQSL